MQFYKNVYLTIWKMHLHVFHYYATQLSYLYNKFWKRKHLMLKLMEEIEGIIFYFYTNQGYTQLTQTENQCTVNEFF